MTDKITALARTLIATAIVTVVITSAAVPQDGKLVDERPVTLDEVLKPGDTFDPTIGEIMEKVDLKAITYLSDGLQVKGYLATPKAGRNLPCVIFNRGGNRSFGAFSDAGSGSAADAGGSQVQRDVQPG